MSFPDARFSDGIARAKNRTRGAASLAATLALLGLTSTARAQSEADRPDVVRVTHDVRDEIPILAYTYTAAGVSAPSIGAQGYGIALAASKQSALPGGGVMIYGSPINRLTLIGDAGRDESGNFAPSAAVQVRLLGHPTAPGFALSLMAKYKVEGFGVQETDPGAKPGEKEFESEIEGSVIASYVSSGWHLDVNAIAGAGLTDAGEIDVEARLRFGRDIGPYVRVGVDGQVRDRAAGTEKLPSGATADFAAGPQLLIGRGHFFGSITGGPATLGITSPNTVGFLAIATFGGTTL